MTLTTIGHRLIVLAVVSWLLGCGPRVANEPPPQTPTPIETSPDAGLPAVPLTRTGVIVPSDVKLEPVPRAGDAPREALSPTTPSPGAH